MRGLLFVLFLLVAGVAGLGYYRGWFGFTSTGADGKTNITLTVDQNKIKADEKKAEEKVHEFGRQKKE